MNTMDSGGILALIDAGNAALGNRDPALAAQKYAAASEMLCQAGLACSDRQRKQECEHRAAELLRTATSLRNRGHDDGVIRLRFDDIAGLDEVKESLRLRVIYPRTHPEQMQKYGLRSGGGVLLFGPPGTGKTMMAKAVAGELDLPFFCIKPSDVLSKYIGESEQNLASLFAKARMHSEGAIIFVDEIDAIGAARDSGGHESSRRLLTQLLQELDGVQSRGKGLLFLAATNEPWLLDDALIRPGRFDEKCYVSLPDLAARQALLKLQLRDAPLDRGLDLTAIARSTERYSGAELACLCERTRQIPFREVISGGPERGIRTQDFETAMKHVRPAISDARLRKYRDYADS